jgi:uncharacterized protein (DUF983 family)
MSGSMEKPAGFAVQQTPRNLLIGLQRGLSRKCPACGQTALFDGYLQLHPVCSACGSENGRYPSDDFAPYLTIFLVLHIFVPLLVLMDNTWDMSVWLEGVIALPFFLAVTLMMLPFVKGGVIGFAWAFDVIRGR